MAGAIWPLGQLARRSNLLPFLLVSIGPLNDDRGGHLVLASCTGKLRHLVDEPLTAPLFLFAGILGSNGCRSG